MYATTRAVITLCTLALFALVLPFHCKFVEDLTFNQVDRIAVIPQLNGALQAKPGDCLVLHIQVLDRDNKGINAVPVFFSLASQAKGLQFARDAISRLLQVQTQFRAIGGGRSTSCAGEADTAKEPYANGIASTTLKIPDDAPVGEVYIWVGTVFLSTQAQQQSGDAGVPDTAGLGTKAFTQITINITSPQQEASTEPAPAEPQTPAEPTLPDN